MVLGLLLGLVQVACLGIVGISKDTEEHGHMTYRGHIEQGRVVFDEPAPLPEGTPVEILVIANTAGENLDQIPTLAERLAGVIGKAEELPADWSENHDKYLREEHGR